jgi:hypothetical protein
MKIGVPAWPTLPSNRVASCSERIAVAPPSTYTGWLRSPAAASST